MQMNMVKTQGIVLRYTNTSESDRMLTVFSPEMGKITVLAKGCRKPKSRFLSAAQLFSYCDFVLKKYKEIYILTQADIINVYYDIRTDIERLAHATYIMNLTEEVVNVGEGNRHLFALLLKTLSYLSYGDIRPEDVTSVYELKFMSIIGYEPELELCMSCGTKPSTHMRFSMEEGGILCRECSQEAITIPVSIGIIHTMRHILQMEMSGIKVLEASTEIKMQLHKIIPEYICHKLDKKIKSRDFLEPNFYRYDLT